MYGGRLASLHNISTTHTSCSSSELSTAPRDIFAFPLGEWEPSASQDLWLCLSPFSNKTAIFSFPCPIYSLSSTSPFSWSPSTSFFALPLVPRLVGFWFLIPRIFPEILQLIGGNLWGYCITDLGMPPGLPVLQDIEKLRIVRFHWYMKYLDSPWITLMMIYQLVLLFKFKMDSSKHDNWVSNVT